MIVKHLEKRGSMIDKKTIEIMNEQRGETHGV